MVPGEQLLTASFRFVRASGSIPLEIKGREIKVDLTNPATLCAPVFGRENRGADDVGCHNTEIKVNHRARPRGAIDFSGANSKVVRIIVICPRTKKVKPNKEKGIRGA